MIKISASTHPAKQDYLNYVKQAIDAGADFIHCDVMDGQFVKNTAFSHYDVKQINNSSTIVLDVHLMVNEPKNQIINYKSAGADIITVHYEAFENEQNLIDTLKSITKQKALCGLSIKPETSIEQIKHLLNYVDLVLIMSVEPGESGQEFLVESLNKIKQLKQIITKNNFSILIEVDGGVNLNNKDDLIKSGADILVVGSALYNEKNKKEFIAKLKQ